MVFWATPLGNRTADITSYLGIRLLRSVNLEIARACPRGQKWNPCKVIFVAADQTKTSRIWRSNLETPCNSLSGSALAAAQPDSVLYLQLLTHRKDGFPKWSVDDKKAEPCFLLSNSALPRSSRLTVSSPHIFSMRSRESMKAYCPKRSTSVSDQGSCIHPPHAPYDWPSTRTRQTLTGAQSIDSDQNGVSASCLVASTVKITYRQSCKLFPCRPLSSELMAGRRHARSDHAVDYCRGCCDFFEVRETGDIYCPRCYRFCMSPTCVGAILSGTGTAQSQVHERDPACPKVRGTSTGVSPEALLDFLTRLCRFSQLAIPDKM